MFIASLKVNEINLKEKVIKIFMIKSKLKQNCEVQM